MSVNREHLGVVWMLIFRGSTNLSNEEEILVGKYFGLSFGEEKWNLAKMVAGLQQESC